MSGLYTVRTVGIAWYQHRTKHGPGHNWEGTSGAAESDMLCEILMEVKQAGFVMSELIADHDSTVNRIYCRHFPEETLTYYSNHSAKTLHKNLQRVKHNKCQVNKHSGLYMNNTCMCMKT